MKVDSNSPPTLKPIDKSNSKVVSSSASHTKKVSENKLDKQSNQKRISKWFAQVGIGVNSARPVTIDEKIQRKSAMLARRKLTNLENILGRALDFCLDDSKEESIDPDWFFSFVNMAENIFSPAMQELWGKIFAVETAKPGSFSLKTLQVLNQLTHKDALAFRHAVNLAGRRKGESTPKLILGYYQKASIWSLFSSHKEHQINLAEFGLSYPDLLSLMDLGLVHHSEIESGELQVNLPTEWRCSDQIITISAKRGGITLVYYKFTPIGAELFKLVNRQKQDNYVAELKNTLSNAFNLS